jgi:hypothetical protein
MKTTSNSQPEHGCFRRYLYGYSDVNILRNPLQQDAVAYLKMVVDVLKKNASACHPIYIIIYVNRDSSCLIGPRALYFLCLYIGAKRFEIRTKSIRFIYDRYRLYYIFCIYL